MMPDPSEKMKWGEKEAAASDGDDAEKERDREGKGKREKERYGNRRWWGALSEWAKNNHKNHFQKGNEKFTERTFLSHKP